MTNQTAEVARLMKVTEAVVARNWPDRASLRLWLTRGSIPSTWPGRSSRRQTATWFLLRGLPPEALAPAWTSSVPSWSSSTNVGC